MYHIKHIMDRNILNQKGMVIRFLFVNRTGTKDSIHHTTTQLTPISETGVCLFVCLFYLFICLFGCLFYLFICLFVCLFLVVIIGGGGVFGGGGVVVVFELGVWGWGWGWGLCENVD